MEVAEEARQVEIRCKLQEDLVVEVEETVTFLLDYLELQILVVEEVRMETVGQRVPTEDLE